MDNCSGQQSCSFKEQKGRHTFTFHLPAAKFVISRLQLTSQTKNHLTQVVEGTKTKQLSKPKQRCSRLSACKLCPYPQLLGKKRSNTWGRGDTTSLYSYPLRSRSPPFQTKVDQHIQVKHHVPTLLKSHEPALDLKCPKEYAHQRLLVFTTTEEVLGYKSV